LPPREAVAALSQPNALTSRWLDRGEVAAHRVVGQGAGAAEPGQGFVQVFRRIAMGTRRQRHISPQLAIADRGGLEFALEAGVGDGEHGRDAVLVGCARARRRCRTR
jgi:hypothetical protein